MNRREPHVLLRPQSISNRRPKNRGSRIASNAHSQPEATPDARPFPSQSQQARPAGARLPPGFSRHRRTKRMRATKKALSRYSRQGLAVILPALAWLSLVGLHPCRAQLRFTKQHSLYFKLPEPSQERTTGSQVAQNLTARNVHMGPKPTEPDHRLQRPNVSIGRTIMQEVTALVLTRSTASIY
jgi:hypothetical protein